MYGNMGWWMESIANLINIRNIDIFRVEWAMNISWKPLTDWTPSLCYLNANSLPRTKQITFSYGQGFPVPTGWADLVVIDHQYGAASRCSSFVHRADMDLGFPADHSARWRCGRARRYWSAPLVAGPSERSHGTISRLSAEWTPDMDGTRPSFTQPTNSLAFTVASKQVNQLIWCTYPTNKYPHISLQSKCRRNWY